MLKILPQVYTLIQLPGAPSCFFTLPLGFCPGSTLEGVFINATLFFLNAVKNHSYYTLFLWPLSNILLYKDKWPAFTIIIIID